jgi:acetate kinase
MRVLVLNSGSSSLKFRLLDILEGEPQEKAKPPRALLTGAVKGSGGTPALEIVDAVHLPSGGAAEISSEKAALEPYVVADDEETWIARETVRCVRPKERE